MPGDPWDSSSFMVSSFHYYPSYSAYRTQDTTGAESGHGWSPTDCRKYAGDHGQDVNSAGTLLNAYSNATPRGPSFDPSSNLVDGVVASQVSAMVSNNLLCKTGLNVSAQMGPARDGYKCPVCDEVLRRPQDREGHILLHLPHWLHCPIGDCAWRGDRWLNLRKHRLKMHPSSGEEVDRKESMIYDPWPLVESIKDGATLQIVTQNAISLVRERALRVKKLALWEGNFSGRKEKKDKDDEKRSRAKGRA